MNIGGKLTVERIEQIKAMLADKETGMTYKEIAIKNWLPMQRVIKLITKGRFLEKFGKLNR